MPRAPLTFVVGSASRLTRLTRLTRLALVSLGALGAASALPACAKPKREDAPAPSAVAEAGAAPATTANAARATLCTDGMHRRGDHWKVDCNVCRCGADGAILCSEFPCADRAATDASSPTARDH